jgi:hypothetical protein
VGKAYDQLRVGDRFDLDGRRFEATGRMVLRSPDGYQWSEWLFVPEQSNARAAIADGVHRWLVFEPGVGLSLWSEVKEPVGFHRDDVLKSRALQYLGRTYRLVERDSFRVDDIQGDVGHDVSKNETVEYADLRSGMERMTIEWNERGLDLTHGQAITAHDLVSWARKAGNDLTARMATSTRSSAATKAAALRADYEAGRDSVGGGKSIGETLGGFLFALVFLPFVIMIEECDGDDCYTRTNPTTGQVETICDDSVRGRGGWGGK